MKFLKKRWVAVVLCVIMVLAAVVIAVGRTQTATYEPSNLHAAEDWGEENYEAYTGFVRDEADALSTGTVKALSEVNAALDYTYGSICGVAVVDGVSGTMEDAAYDMYATLELGDDDCLLLLDVAQEQWYFVYGDDFSWYVDNELEILFQGGLNDDYDKLNSMLPETFEELADWYEDHVPVEQEGAAEASYGGGIAIMSILLIVLVIVIVVISILNSIRRRIVGGWGFWGGHWHHHHRPTPPPPPGPHYGLHHGPGPGPRPGGRPNPGPRPGGSRPSGGRSGGFGGGSCAPR